MLINCFKKTLCNASVIRISACRNVSQKQKTPFEADKVDSNVMPEYLRTAVNKRMTTPFSEVKEESFFVSLVKSFESNREGPPERIAWNKDSFTWANLKKNVISKRKEYAIFQQRFMPERHNQLGNEIAAAHFIVFRGGGIKFFGCDKWVKMKKDDDVESYNKDLPKKFVPSVYIECIDASKMQLYYEGLENIHKLANLKWLSIRGNKLMDDWCLDWICNEFSHSLEYLDISDCNKITYRGLAALCKTKKLSKLVAHNISDSYEFQLSCLMLQDVFPNLITEGVDYLKLNSTENFYGSSHSNTSSSSSGVSENNTVNNEKTDEKLRKCST